MRQLRIFSNTSISNAVRLRAMASLLVSLLLLGLISSSALAQQAPSTESAISVLADGLVPFDGDDNVGNDSSATNGRVRNVDTLVYNIEVSLNDQDDTNVAVTVTLNDKAK